MVTFKKYISLNEVATSTPQAGTAYGGGNIKEFPGKHRKLPLSPGMKNAIQNGLRGSGLDWHSYSGGQLASNRAPGSSHRHDNGNGTDGDFIESGTGRALNGDNPQDRQKIASVLGKLKAAGVKGFGWDSSSTGRGHYMGSTRFHLDVAGPPAVWGHTTRSNSAAAWVVNAVGGIPQGDVEGDTGDTDEGSNLPPGTSGAPGTDYDSPAAAVQGLAQGADLAFGRGMFT